MLNIVNYNIKKDDILICIISANAYLKQEGIYTAQSDLSEYGTVLVKNDFDYTTYYNKNRFIPKADMRDFNIDLIIK
jgi:hypothetical protein